MRSGSKPKVKTSNLKDSVIITGTPTIRLKRDVLMFLTEKTLEISYTVCEERKVLQLRLMLRQLERQDDTEPVTVRTRVDKTEVTVVRKLVSEIELNHSTEVVITTI